VKGRERQRRRRGEIFHSAGEGGRVSLLLPNSNGDGERRCVGFKHCLWRVGSFRYRVHASLGEGRFDGGGRRGMSAGREGSTRLVGFFLFVAKEALFFLEKAGKM
jgi:hypothetical protein